MDKLGSHKGLASTALATSFSSFPYNLNSIEQIAKLKPLMRKGNERSVEAAWQRFGSLRNAFLSVFCGLKIRSHGPACTPQMPCGP